MTDRDTIRRRVTAVAVVVGVWGVFFAGTATSRLREHSPSDVAPRYTTPLGEELPAATLKTIDGRPISLRERLGGRPALIYVFGVAECASCSNLPLEFKIVRREAPALQTLLIGSGARAAEFAEPVRHMGLDSVALVDEDRVLIHALKLSAEPAVILVDSTGRILLADTRGAASATQYPMGRVINGLSAVLHPASAPHTK